MDTKKLAELIFPSISQTIGDLEAKYAPRDLKEGAEVTRFAPSPTGFLHTGSLFAALLAKHVARQTDGVFYLRLEDTDTKREIEGTGVQLLKEMQIFGVQPDEGYFGNKEIGNYGPYKQSDRAQIYKTIIKQMIIDNLAYPCFEDQEALTKMRELQEASKVLPGYWGQYAKSSFLTPQEAAIKIENGEPYVIRFRSSGDHTKFIKVTDLVRGELEIAENSQHIIILKSDGLPTYHFAHVVDDHFMKTTIVSRGEEWISSLPLHIQLFNALKWPAPKYAHLPVINKLDNGNKRKLSKRKDSEAAVTYFLEQGYPTTAILTYLMSIANSNFEEWWETDKTKKYEDFLFSYKKMSLDGALFDIEKVNFFAREYFATLNAKQMKDAVVNYATYVNDQKLLELINSDENKFISIMNIEREQVNPRKDYAHLSTVYESVRFFYIKEYVTDLEKGQYDKYNDKFDNKTLIHILNTLKEKLVYGLDNTSWFESLKQIGVGLAFAQNKKEFKADPTHYIGMIGDLAEILRISVTLKKQSPNLHDVLQILGKEEVNTRLDLVIKSLN